MTDEHHTEVAALRAELARVTAERDTLSAKLAKALSVMKYEAGHAIDGLDCVCNAVSEALSKTVDEIEA